jgi:hypothetical protein
LRNAYPDIEAFLDQQEGQRSLGVSETHPYLTVHQEAVVQVHNPLLDASWAAVDLYILLTLLPRQPVQAKEEAILGLNHMFLGGISEKSA